jgi:hypothetical protein
MRMVLVIPRLTAFATAAVLSAVLALPPSSFAQAPPPKTDTTRGLSVQYADGRISTGPVRRTGGMWTSTFPTIAGADTSRNGVPLTTLDVKHVIEGADVVATVSLYYGGPGQNGVTVATVRLSQDQPVAVNELRAFGVEPITLSLVAIAPTSAYAPEVISVSPLLSARAEAVGDNVSAYRVLVTNRSTQPVMWMQFKAYRGNSLATLVRPRGKRNLPLILPNTEYSFHITTNTGGLDAADRSETWRALDRIELTSLMWQDGVVEGDPASATDQRMVDLRRARQLEALLAALRGAARVSIADLRAQIAGGMGSDLETRRGRDAMLADLDRFAAAQMSSQAPDFRAWLGRTIPEYEEWLARIKSKP